MCKEGGELKKIDFLRRNLSNIDKSNDNGCWLWKGRKNHDGYGLTRFHDGSGTRFAHRIFYKIFVGDIPEGMFVCHRCDVRECVNPSHLFLGTPKDNHADMVAKGRGADFSLVRKSGEECPRAKLKTADVLDIRARYDSRESKFSLADEYGVKHQAIYKIVRRVNWKHI